MKRFNSTGEIDAEIAQSRLHVLYVSDGACSVAEAVWPKIEALRAKFPEAEMSFVLLDDLPELAGRFSIFTVPVVIVHFEGKEVLRQARIPQLGALEQTLKRFSEFME
ncbi:MAG TPA: thioredoxin family protein [Pantanalinema sp.]